MMCQCDEVRGRRFLPHQLSHGKELQSQCRVKVTHGFQPGVCRECRGLAPLTEPVAAIHGRTTKIRRYYWRELFFRIQEILADGAAIDLEGAEVLALEEIKKAHALSPKYDLHEESERDFLSRYPVEVQEEHATVQKGGVIELETDSTCSPEEYVAAQLSKAGYRNIFCESTPFHALFAVFLWPVIQDRTDPLVRYARFGDRPSFELNGRSDYEIVTPLPEDFGTSAYASRRTEAIQNFFSEFQAVSHINLLSVFESRVEGSADLRQYLWAHHEQDLERARKLLEVLPMDAISACLRYLVQDYWRNYLGWPDLLAWRGSEVLFVEVKLSRDKLSEDQRHWIEANCTTLKLPFRMIKIHRKQRAS